MEKKLLILKTGENVVDRYQSHLHNDVLQILPGALSKVESNGRKFIVEEIQMGRIIGETICVATKPGDQIVYAKRPKRFGLTRFVKNQKPELSSSVVTILKKAEEGDFFILITAFIGNIAEPEPWDRNATEKSRDFWETHALVWGYEEIVPGTETIECPW
jgi:hypothetical protein